LTSGVQSTDFSRVSVMQKKGPTKVGTLNAVKLRRTLELNRATQARIMVSSILNLVAALTACGIFAGRGQFAPAGVILGWAF
jgi:hypothetical protein